MPIIELDQVTHPLLGRRHPRLESLLERCDPEAKKTFETAMAFARTRIASQTRALEIAKELEHAPWAEPGLNWSEPPRAVTSTDMLRALLALYGDRVAEIAFGAEHVSTYFREVEAHWRGAIEIPHEPSTEPLELEPIWARRWALIDNGQPIHRDALIGRVTASSLRQLASFDDRYMEGLITGDEALNRLVDQMACVGVSANFAGSLPPAYWDRYGGLSELDRLLSCAPGAIVVGPEGSGRHALVEAWGRRLRQAGPTLLRQFGFNIDNFHGPGWVEWRGNNVTTWAAIDSRSIAVMSNFGAELRFPDPESRRFPEYCLAFANDPANEFRLVIVTTPEELKQLEPRLPALNGFPKLEVPIIRDDELLAIWICQTLALEDRLAVSLPIWRLVDRLTSRSPPQRRNFDTHADLLCSTELTGHEAAFRSAARRALRGKSTELSIQTMMRRRELASWVDPQSWPSLVHLDAALRARVWG